MKPHSFAALVLMFVAGASASADLFRWVDEHGVTHYSDRQPIHTDAVAKVERVRPGISVYSPDRTLMRALEAQRLTKSEPETPSEPYRQAAPHFVAMDAPPPAVYAPCPGADCPGISGLAYPYPGPAFLSVRRRTPQLVQAVLPPGAIAGTVNSSGFIPGNSAAVANVIPPRPGPRERPLNSRPLLEPLPHRR